MECEAVKYNLALTEKRANAFSILFLRFAATVSERGRELPVCYLPPE